MKFESLRCDECNRIQDGANHWLKMKVYSCEERTVSVGIGDVESQSPYSGRINQEVHDLCGQSCAVKHIAKLLKWNVAAEAADNG